MSISKYFFLRQYLYFYLTRNDDLLHLDISKMDNHDSDKLFSQNKMYNFHYHSFGLSASIFFLFNDQNIFQIYKYSNLITASMAGPLQNKMVM